ncbi:MAG: hypothetical protein ACPL1F_05950 [bacterium]
MSISFFISFKSFPLLSSDVIYSLNAGYLFINSMNLSISSMILSISSLSISSIDLSVGILDCM